MRARIVPATDLELISLQTRALFEHDDEGRIRGFRARVGIPGCPRFFIGLTRSGAVWRFRRDLADEAMWELEALASAQPVLADPQGLDPRPYRRLIERDGPIEFEFFGPAYRFPPELEVPKDLVRITEDDAELLAPGFGYLVDEVAKRQPVVAAVRDGKVVSVCLTAAASEDAAEAGVATLAAYRRRGLGTAVVAGWAAAVHDAGLLPLYSTSWDNLASQATARTLGLVQYGVDLHFT